MAILVNSRLDIRTTSSLELLRTITTSIQGSTLRWSPIRSSSDTSSRVLLASDENVRVWDIYDERWSAAINNGSGGMGKLVNVEFGRSREEVLCFSDFGSKLTAWNLKSGTSVEIRDPKFSTRGYGYRPHTGLFALLSRPGPQDILTLHAPTTYFVVKTVTLLTVDAQGVKWSPDGRWMVVWDTPSVGLKIYVYTADGHLYRVYSGDSEDTLGLGVKSIEWSPRGDYLAIGGHDRRVVLLSTRTFSPVMVLDHTSSIQLSRGSMVWQEQVTGTSQRSYTTVQQPVAPPTAPDSPSNQATKTGLSLIAFNANGTVVATRDDSVPTTVWLWDLTKLTATAVLVQHSPVKQLSWHPTIASLLLIQCSHDEPTLYFYDTTNEVPYTLDVSFQKTAGRIEAQWLSTASNSNFALLLGDTQSFVLVWPEGRDQILKFENNEHGGAEAEAEEEDSLFDILTGKTPIKELDRTELLVSDVLEEDTEVLDDTFVGRGGFGVT
ncbi:tricorn protease N-terminal domain-containing protein [Tothia fuscella]|uniref:Tricorn protease N-terminal domain-containing protein n=1 Tax=Tothia fuscella TaxID=1048955 RepID=A0A9P4NUX0_9PEZI|nr:tricorn protease N-terminal domain-containing protein [Tothia fuscella]